jgi:hypothetical protein
MHSLRVYADPVEKIDSTHYRFGIELKDEHDHSLPGAYRLQMGIFDSGKCANPHATMAFDAVSRGSILTALGFAAAEIETPEDGLFKAVVTGSPGDIGYLAVAQSFSGPVVEHTDIIEIHLV